MEFLTAEQIISVQQAVEKEQNHMINESGLRSSTDKYFATSYYDSLGEMDIALNYMEDVINRHVFGNGNKRTAIVSAILFLEMNGLRVSADNEVLYDLILDYFNHKNTDRIRAYLETCITTRSYPNPWVSSKNYHLENILEMYQPLIEKLSLT